MSRHTHPAPRSARGRSLVPGAAMFLAATLCMACAPTTSGGPPMAPQGAPPSPFPQEMVAGGHVMVNRGGQWVPGTIVQPLGGDRYMVSYDGAGPQWNEQVGMDRIKPISTYGTQPAAHDYRPGERVIVTSQSRLVVGDVVQQVAADAWRVHYDGYGPEAVENVPSNRLRRAYTGPSAHGVGEPVMVELNGQVHAARVLAASATDRWIVRFDGAGPQYDQDVGTDRIRGGAPQAAAPSALVSTPPPAAPEPTPPPPPAKPEKGAKKGDKGDKDKGAAAAPPPPPAPLTVGDNVVVLDRGIYFPAQISAPGANGGFRVRFQGSATDEEVTADRVARQLAPLKGVKYEVNQLVLVEWHGMYAPGKVTRDAGHSEYSIRFDGMGAEADELVPARRLRPRQ
ncbi:MAG: hypothetical protein U0359_19720 [Byssovorax sp.]